MQAKLCLSLSKCISRLKTPVENSLRDAKLSFKDLDEVILVGGSTRIPAVQELVKKMTGKDPNVTVNPDEVVALGAAVQVSLFQQCLLAFIINLLLSNCMIMIIMQNLYDYIFISMFVYLNLKLCTHLN